MTYLSNAHTHSTFCDGKSTPEEMVQKAIELGYTSLGFSGHSYLPQTEDDPWTMTPENTLRYIQKINELKQSYRDQITLYLGLEMDSFSETDLSPYEYVIGSVHMFHDIKADRYLSYDNGTEEFLILFNEIFDSNPIKMAETYYSQVLEHMRSTRPTILGHYNLITKYNDALHLIDEEDPAYKKIAGDILLEAASYAQCVEVNTGAISRGHAKIPYPNEWMLKLLVEHHVPLILTCDCHDKDLLGVGYTDALDLLKKVGCSSLLILGQRELFEEIPLL